MTTVGRSPRNEGMGALLERDRELREAVALLADVRADRGRMLLIEAPPGLGKSTLVDHIAALAITDGLRVVTAAGRELEQGLGWGVARSLFEPWLFSVPAAERDELQSGPAASARVLFEPDAEVEDRVGARVSRCGRAAAPPRWTATCRRPAPRTATSWASRRSTETATAPRVPTRARSSTATRRPRSSRSASQARARPARRSGSPPRRPTPTAIT
jgi:energy-coupling factor transporter ATP-binding protein EcfA2